jgi:hypothetical protein
MLEAVSHKRITFWGKRKKKSTSLTSYDNGNGVVSKHKHGVAIKIFERSVSQNTELCEPVGPFMG